MPASSFDDDETSGLVARSGDGDNAAPLSITEISTLLKRSVEDRFGYVRLRGELSGVKRAASGHLYCSLKDEKAVIDGVMWRGNTGKLSFQPEDGIEVVASGKLTTFAGRSKYQIVMDTMEIAGEGALLALLEKTRLRLEAEGLFSSDRKNPLPFLPRVIGVVTSPTGAVLRDILHRLADRFPSQVLVWPVLVQGKGSADQVASAIRGFSELPDNLPRPDVLIVARGGGSIEDLWGFNEEVVVRAIAECPIPIISAVGHETDTTLADFAADLRAPTPTAAAEMAVPVRAELASTLEDFAHRQKRAITRPVILGRERLDARLQRLPKPEALLQPHSQKLDESTESLRRGLRDRAARGREKLGSLRLSPASLERGLRDAQQKLAVNRFSGALATNRIEGEVEKFAALERLYASLNPEAPLQRGFVLVKDADGNLVRTKEVAASHGKLGIKFTDGVLDVVTGETASASGKHPSSKPRRAKPRPNQAPSRQDDLFG